MSFYVVYSDEFLRHDAGEGHPESPERIRAICKTLRGSGQAEFVEPERANEEELELVHTKKHLANLAQLSKLQSWFPDNKFTENTYGIAKLAAGAAYKAAELSGEKFAFAAVRPPGHHAGRDYFAGFCYINNIAFAVRKIQKKERKTVMIVDFDMHYGNGTADIFRGDEKVFFLSFHQDPGTTYPGTGFENESTANAKNVVVMPGAGDEKYLKIFSESVEKYFDEFKPDLIAVSAGFDTYCEDAMVGSRIGIMRSETYGEIGKIIAGLGKRTFAVLEGGYYTPKLGENVFEFIRPFIR